VLGNQHSAQDVEAGIAHSEIDSIAFRWFQANRDLLGHGSAVRDSGQKSHKQTGDPVGTSEASIQSLMNESHGSAMGSDERENDSAQ